MEPITYRILQHTSFINIYNLDVNLGVMINNFGKGMMGDVDNEGSNYWLQNDTGELAEKWYMKCNPQKCVVMHFGRSNKTRIYTTMGLRIYWGTEASSTYWLACRSGHHAVEDVILLQRCRENAQVLPGLESLHYEEKLKRLGLFSREWLRLSGERIEFDKIKFDGSNFFLQIWDR